MRKAETTDMTTDCDVRQVGVDRLQSEVKDLWIKVSHGGPMASAAARFE